MNGLLLSMKLIRRMESFGIYAQIGVMHKQQLENLLSMLNVNKVTTECTELQRSSLAKLQEEIRTNRKKPGKRRRMLRKPKPTLSQQTRHLSELATHWRRHASRILKLTQQNTKITQQNNKIIQQLQDKQRTRPKSNYDPETS